MAKIYWRTIKNGTRAFEDVPAKMKDAVKALALAEVENGEITAEQYKAFIGEDYPAQDAE